MRQSRRRFMCIGASLGVGLGTGLPTAARSSGGRALRIIVPFARGGSTDVIARPLTAGLTRELGRSVIVQSKAGAGSVIGSDAVAKSAPDGQTVPLTTSAISILPSLGPKLPYGPNALVPITILGRAPSVFVVHADRPLKSAADFLAHARAHPGKLTYGSSGNGLLDASVG